MRAPLPAQERERLKALRSHQILDSPPEMRYEDLTLLAAGICRAPIAAISLVDEDRQWFKSIVGLEVKQTSRDVAFCAHAILQPNATLVVEDARRDERFADNALVTGNPGIRFYAGTPLAVSGRQPTGTRCMIDTVPRTLTELERQALEVLGRQVVAQLELRSPPTPIHHFLQILLDGIGGPLTAEQLGKMIGDLLELTRAKNGKLSVEPCRMRLDTIITDVAASAAICARSSGIGLAAGAVAYFQKPADFKALLKVIREALGEAAPSAAAGAAQASSLG